MRRSSDLAGGVAAGAFHRCRALAQGPGQGPRAAVVKGAALVQRTAGAAAGGGGVPGAGQAVLTGAPTRRARRRGRRCGARRSEEHTSELQSLMRISYAVFCLKNKKAK